MISGLNVKDFTSPRREYFFEIPSLLLEYFIDKLEDKRDIPMIHTTWNITVSVLLSLLLQLYSPFSTDLGKHLLGIFCLLIIQNLWIKRFFLLLHFTQHRRLFRKDFYNWNYFI